MAEELAVWLYGTRVALIDRDRRGRPTLRYTDDAFDRYEPGTPLLSLALPLARPRYAQAVTRAFLDGLLPEGEARTVIANDVGVERDDTFGLLRALGRDCAGAVVIQPAGDPAPPPPAISHAEPIDDAELERLVSNLRTAPLGVGGRVRVSLAGVQEKLVLTRRPDGGWGRPVDGTPSTHILKPEIAAYPKTVANEAFCMRLARQLEVQTADIEATTVARRDLIVVTRYDRIIRDDGVVERLHQEDFCQATGILPQRKYEADGGPSLRRIAGIVQTAIGHQSLETLLQAVTINVMIGNGDAHGKNYSLLHRPVGTLSLAPAYDLMCTLVYGDDGLAMKVDGVERITTVTADRLLNEARRWGLGRPRAEHVIGRLLGRAPEALRSARDETPDVPEDVVRVVERQLARLRS